METMTIRIAPQAITPTPHQQDAIGWIVEQIVTGTEAIALRGLAGTGKSTCIPMLEAELLDRDLSVTIGAPTHRAAMILRRKGLTTADTIHAQALTPYFQPEYACAVDWLTLNSIDDMGRFQPCPTKRPYTARDYTDDALQPLLLRDALLRHGTTMDAVRQIAARGPHGPRRALASLGIHGSRYFDGFGAKEGEGVLIIDEASMVGQATLEMCLQAFPQVILIGDPGQLPPVKEPAVLASIAGRELTEIHRQASDSPIIQLAYAARTGMADWSALPYAPGALDEWSSVAASAFLTSPLIVWRNATRVNCTAAIRAALGYPDHAVVAGEPLVCRSSSPEDRVLGFFNNGMCRVIQVIDATHAVLAPDGREDDPDSYETIRLHLEELHGDSIHPDAIPFRFGYCLTAHTAQGGEWGTVYIAKPDMLAYMGMCRRKGADAQADAARWAYTAITRAKQTLGFVLNYKFTSPQETHAMPPKTVDVFENTPLLSDDAKKEAELDTLFGKEDDIPEVSLPASMQPAPIVEPVTTVDPATPAGQVVMTLDEALWKFSQHGAMLLNKVEESWQAKLRTLNLQQDAIATLAEGIKTYAPVVPYGATVHVTSPTGFVMQLTVQQTTQDGFLDAVGSLMNFLKTHEFTPHVPAPF